MTIPNDWIVEVAWILIPVIVGYVARVVAPAVRRFYESRTTVEQRKEIEALARVAVLAAEAVYGSQAGQAKLAYAKQVMNEALAAKNIPTTVDEIYAHIEAAVQDEFNGRYGQHYEAKSAAKTTSLEGETVVR